MQWLIALLVFLLLVFASIPAYPYEASTQSNEPWTLKQCDRLRPNTDMVMNVSLWNYGGWPLFRVICYWRGK